MPVAKLGESNRECTKQIRIPNSNNLFTVTRLQIIYSLVHRRYCVINGYKSLAENVSWSCRGGMNPISGVQDLNLMIFLDSKKLRIPFQIRIIFGSRWQLNCIISELLDPNLWESAHLYFLSKGAGASSG